MSFALPLIAGIIALASILLSHRTSNPNTFFHGQSEAGSAPGLWTLVFSQVTTWIFARSLLNAAILGYYYGLWGTLAYACYYLSFITGGIIIDQLRFRHGFNSIQAFLEDRFGIWGSRCYNLVIGIRLISEVFANLLVIGILFGAAGSNLYVAAIIGFAVVTLLYSMLGGLHASLRTDLFQMLIFLATLALLLILATGSGVMTLDNLMFKEFVISDPGPVLMLVALLQVWSYPMHDPVMMDRGLLADRETTRKSFLHAAWISILCMIAFGSLGIVAGAQATSGEAMTAVLQRLLGDVPMLLFNAALVISAMSTLDSTLSSSSKLVVIDMKLLPRQVMNGRGVMLLFMLLGVLLVFVGNKDLFSAVAVSGTASMYLLPVIFFSLLGGRRDIPLWSYLGSFVVAVGGAALYFTESSGHSQLMGEAHKYTKLLIICVTVLVAGCVLFALGLMTANKDRLTSESAPA
ncbi:sodium:proline symporter [Aestuariirhabdus sp. Z084]|uniref:sodium:proline symporter n=1 Tax=Aestuariirhabdus haliotis TaxID=2918751 RepID=UPI00201B427E|nr:sodium:proline symporter [Aestuariirhabdus haliotis]MCL6415934.1 sodium:proline symporter [Aestuariirhabdus haliotis]MCL6419932.1 sodium:proline symporter [Aestuariirhabdus haliotis]